jgi:hypothetical protein
MLVVNHTFTSNTAVAAGGAIYLTAPLQTNIPLANLDSSPYSISSSSQDPHFEAPSTPACVSVVNAHIKLFTPSLILPSRSLNILTNNTILGGAQSIGYGPDIATADACMLRTKSASVSSATRREVIQPHIVAASGETFSVLLRSFDAYGQLISWPLPNVAYTATASSSSSSSSSSTTNSTSTSTSTSSGSEVGVSIMAPTKAVFNHDRRCLELQNLSLVSTDTTFYNLTISANIAASSQSIAQTLVMVQLRSCCVGQVTTGNSCTSCSSIMRNQYSFSPKRQTCDNCPNHAVCGGGTLMPIDGYWHASPRGDKLYVCPVYDSCSFPNRTAILEGLQQQFLDTCGQPELKGVDVRSYTQVQCKKGYGGNVCGNCQPSGEKMSGRRGQVCSTCASRLALLFCILFACSSDQAGGVYVYAGLIMHALLFAAGVRCIDVCVLVC